MLLVRNIRLPLTCPDPDAEAAAKALAILRVPARRAAHCGVAKLSVDARHGTPVLVYTIAVTLKDEGEESALAGASPCVCYTQPPKFDFTTGENAADPSPGGRRSWPGRPVRGAAAGPQRLPPAGARARPCAGRTDSGRRAF
ncbi:hypothetical protein [Gemmiger formicilis]|uniref:hypothetical protein n=1 Tax=Gemmiger formicilis TaxID=745368 RepID=UPI003522BB35